MHEVKSEEKNQETLFLVSQREHMDNVGTSTNVASKHMTSMINLFSKLKDTDFEEVKIGY